ncbi:MAG: hypothetical protein MGG11_15735 [Trichodesmium sp. MAG_R03]|jgi:molecular chaperone DnaK (HSP70)|nr:hypothetical protein [Trichodesmium sp. MAG_R03]
MYLAIDFGTSNTKAALVIEEQLILVRDPFKPESSFFPSSVYLTGEGQILVGHAADGMRDNDIHRYRKEFKRDLGGIFLINWAIANYYLKIYSLRFYLKSNRKQEKWFKVTEKIL